jgi:hypothetical protein
MHLPEWGPRHPRKRCSVTYLNESVLGVHNSFLNVDGALGPIAEIVLNQDTKPLRPLEAQMSDQKTQFQWYELVE